MKGSLQLENRRSIFNYILHNPGSHLRKISRQLDITMGTLRHHLDYLEKMDLIVSKRENNLRIYFASGEMGSRDKKITSLLQQKRFRDIIVVVLTRPGAICSEVSDELNLKRSTLSKYIGILEDRKIVYHRRSGREKQLFVSDEKRIVEMLLLYRRSFWDSLVDNVLEIYFER